MSGNVREWVSDWYDENYYSKSQGRNPKGPSTGEYRVLRGGSWAYEPDLDRSAYRNWNISTIRLDTLGFRCAQDVPK
jgi:formylglycine-generating enzyme required for sulfatase activity